MGKQSGGEGIGAVGVEENGGADVFCADHGGDAGQGDVQFVGRRGGWQEDAALDALRVCGREMQAVGAHGCAGRVAFEVKLKEFEDGARVVERDGEFQAAGAGFIFESELKFELACGLRLGTETVAEFAGRAAEEE